MNPSLIDRLLVAAIGYCIGVYLYFCVCIFVGAGEDEPQPEPPAPVTHAEVCGTKVILWNNKAWPVTFYPWGHYQYVWNNNTYAGFWWVDGMRLVLREDSLECKFILNRTRKGLASKKYEHGWCVEVQP